MRRPSGSLLATFLVCLLAASVNWAPSQAQRDPVVYPIVFPVAGDHHFSRDFGDPRSGGRTHEGTDILAEKLTPVVAVADGTVRWLFDERGGDCCAISVVHDDGWRSRYLHLNNDTPGTDDGKGYGIARGIRVGARVRAGQVIGFVGDSGNAEATSAHLHFELRRPDGTPVDPFTTLQAALAHPSTSPAPRIAGPAVRPPADLRPELRRPGRAPEVRPAEPRSPVAEERTELPEAGDEPVAGEEPGVEPTAPGLPTDEAEAPGEADERAETLPVTPFVPVPADDCSAGFDRAMELAEVHAAQRPGLACFRFRSRDASGG